jgi:NAD(P)-dependent dehydrogenase (short-subunit alcohol dehydrogenase family)
MKTKWKVALVAGGVSGLGLSAVKELLKVRRKLLWKLY